MRSMVCLQKFAFSRGKHLSCMGTNTGWTPVFLPHDMNVDAPYAVEGPWPSQQGYIQSRSDGTYRCVFTKDDENPVTYLLADGIYRDCEIYVNGMHVGGSPYGYIPMILDISNFVKPGENSLEIYVNNQNVRDDRWYSGAGIYRRLSLLSVSKAHFVPDGVAIRTEIRPDGSAEVSVTAELAGAASGQTVDVTIFGKHGAEASGKADAADGGASVCLVLEKPSLWSPEEPNLYHIELTLCENGNVVDQTKETFGVRQVKFDAKNGLRINGKHTYLCGVNLHHDCGCLGAAFYPEVWRERLATLKSFGLNAVRTSHNPQAKEFYSLCDEMGILVVDELYDKWDEGSYDAHFWEWYERDVAAWIRRDRNHPSVILYSVGNEVACQGLPTLFDPLDKLVAAVKQHDDTRPVSFGMHPFGWPEEVAALSPEGKAKIAANIAKHVDVLLCNYQEQWYELYHALTPETCIIGSELYHWYTTVKDDPFHYVEKHPWQYVYELPYVLGGFYWAGIDYRGESSEPPVRGWASGLLDITGHPKPQSYLSQAYWTATPMVAAALSVPKDALPPAFERHGWSFPPCVPHLNLLPEEGPATILVFTNCESASLWQNGKKLAEKPFKTVGRCLFFEVSLEKGEDLLIYGENNGTKAAEFALSPYGEPAGLSVTASKTELDGENSADASVIRIQLVDEKGRSCYQSGSEVSVSLSGLTFLGIDNGDMASRHSYLHPKLPLYNGRVVLFVRGSRKGKGEVVVSCENWKASVSIEVL